MFGEVMLVILSYHFFFLLLFTVDFILSHDFNLVNDSCNVLYLVFERVVIFFLGSHFSSKYFLKGIIQLK